MASFHVYAINIYKNGPPFKQILACDMLRSILIAFTNKNSVVFIQIRMYLIKFLTIIVSIRITADMFR